MTFEKVKEIIVDSIGCDEGMIAMEVSLVDDLGMDSLDAVELNMALEEAFEISIPDDVLAGFVTVEDVVNYIDSVNA
jgi:acyl carrier protein